MITGKVLAEDPSPGMTRGPYWVDEMLHRSNITADPATGTVALGFPLRLSINVSRLDAHGDPTSLSDAIVDIWHCKALGLCSDIASENTLGMEFLRGYRVTDRRGTVRFTTIYSRWYQGRTVHIHVRMRVYDAETDTVTNNQSTQLFFPDEISNQVFTLPPYDQRPSRDTFIANDGIYNADSDEDGVEDGDELQLTLSAKRNYAIGTCNIYLDLSDGNGNGNDQDGGGGPPPEGGRPSPDGDGRPPDGGGGPPPFV